MATLKTIYIAVINTTNDMTGSEHLKSCLWPEPDV